MKINFKQIKINNFLSIGEASINLNTPGYTLVNGVNTNPIDAAKSNGSGKSSIWEAISWCLTGETIRGSKDVSNFYGEDGALVELYFDVDKDSYHIIRSKDHSKYKTNLKIFINEEDKSGKGIRDSEKLLAEYLPDLNSSLIGSVIILGQGLPSRFSNNTPSGRKEVLEKLSKSDFMIADIKDRLTRRKADLQNNLRAEEDAILRLTTEIKCLEDKLKEKEAKLSDFQNVDFQSNLTQIQLEYDRETENIKSIEEEIEELNSSKTKISQQTLDTQRRMQAELDEVKNQSNNDIIEGNNNINSKQYEIKTLSNKITELKSIKDVCPTCGQKIPNVIKPDTSKEEAELEVLTEELQKLNVIISDIKQKLDNQLNNIKASYNKTLEELRQQDNNILHNLTLKESLLKEGLKRQQSLGVELNSIQWNIANAEKAKQDLINEINVIEQDLQTKSEELLYNNSGKESISKHIDVIGKMTTLASRDFRGYLLSNTINFINRRAKSYSLDVFETDKIDIELDGNNLLISYDGKEYSNLSGGEKQKVDLITQFAIRDMLCNFLGFSSNILVLDEILDNLDEIGCQKVLNMITKQLSDVESIYIISHHDMSIPYDQSITIIKGADKVSRITNAL